MANNGTILAKNVLLKIKEGATFKPVGMAKESELSFSKETIPTGSKQTGGWSSARAGTKSWAMSGGGNAVNSTTEVSVASFDKLYEAFKSDDPITVAWETEGDDDFNYFEGEAILTELKQTANDGEVITFTFSLTGDGAPREIAAP